MARMAKLRRLVTLIYTPNAGHIFLPCNHGHSSVGTQYAALTMGNEEIRIAMRQFHFLALGAGMTCMLAGGVGSAANAATIVNGGFEAQEAGIPVGGDVFTAVTGWNTSNILIATGFYGAVAPEGRIFALAGNGVDDGGGSLSQTITGLTIGQTYVVSFELGGEEWVIPGATEQVEVSMLSGSATASAIFSAPISSNLSAFSGGPLWDHWAFFSFDFIASAVSAEIQFQQTSATAGSGDTGVDNVSISERGFTGVPEPLTLSLFGAGLAGAIALSRRRKKYC